MFPLKHIYSTANPASLPAVIFLYWSMLLVNGCDFTRNSISALAAYASNITVSGDLIFTSKYTCAIGLYTCEHALYNSKITRTHKCDTTGGVYKLDWTGLEYWTSLFKHRLIERVVCNTYHRVIPTLITSANL